LTKTGRPKADNPRKNCVLVRFTDTEYAELKDRASEYDLTIAETIRKEIRFKKPKKT
jgi:hypothetical protein